MMTNRFWLKLAEAVGLKPEGSTMVKTASAVKAPPARDSSRVALADAEKSGFFKRAKAMGWGLYSVEDLDGGLGSIWQVEKDAVTGEQFLVKQMDPAGDVVRRVRTASAKTAAAKRCTCGHSRDQHHDGFGRCLSCDCDKFQDEWYGKAASAFGRPPTKPYLPGTCPGCGLPKQMYRDENPGEKLCGNRQCRLFGNKKSTETDEEFQGRMKTAGIMDLMGGNAYEYYTQDPVCPECKQNIPVVNERFVTHGNGRGQERETTKNSPCLGSGTRVDGKYMPPGGEKTAAEVNPVTGEYCAKCGAAIQLPATYFYLGEPVCSEACGAALATQPSNGADTPCKGCGKPLGMAYFLDDLGICTDCVRKRHKDVVDPGWRKKRAAVEPSSEGPLEVGDGDLAPSVQESAPAAVGPMSDMVRSYLATALWSSNDESDDQGGDPLDKNYEIEDFAPEAVAKATADCAAFEQKAGKLLEGIEREGQDIPDVVGFHFWLTRNGHGSGFWDGDYPKEIGEALTDISHEFGETDAYVGDDGKLYLS